MPGFALKSVVASCREHADLFAAASSTTTATFGVCWRPARQLVASHGCRAAMSMTACLSAFIGARLMLRRIPVKRCGVNCRAVDDAHVDAPVVIGPSPPATPPADYVRVNFASHQTRLVES